jgi:hypothetical protein
MIETPAAAMLAPELAQHVDFFSIGTNDLVQYTLAVDRGNARLAPPLHPLPPRGRPADGPGGARGQRGAGIEVSVCGELASNPLGAFLMIGLGADSLSVAHASLAEIKKVIRSVGRRRRGGGRGSACRRPRRRRSSRPWSAGSGRVLDLGKFGISWKPFPARLSAAPRPHPT